MRYKAFISYARLPDEDVARALERALEAFARPWHRLRAIEVFRDQSDLQSAGGLRSTVVKALDESEYLILLTGPAAAASYWVGQELAYWLAHRPVANLILVRTGGDLVWSRQAGDFDWSQTTALSAACKGRFEEEPLWIDMRFAEDRQRLSLRDEQFLGVIADLSSTLRQLPRSELVGEDVRQHRRLIMLRRTAIAALAGLTVAAAIAAGVAVRQRNQAATHARLARAAELSARENADRAVKSAQEAGKQARRAEENAAEARRQGQIAEERRRVAEEQRRLAVARTLAARAVAQLSNDPQLSLLLSLEAVRIEKTAEAEEALRQAVIEVNLNPSPRDTANIRWREWEGLRGRSPDGAVALTQNGDWTMLELIEQRSSNVILNSGQFLRAEYNPIAEFASFSEDSDFVRTKSELGAVSVWRVDPLERELVLKTHSAAVTATQFSTDRRLLLTSAEDDRTILSERTTGKELHTFPGRIATFSDDGRRIAAASKDVASVWDTASFREIAQLTGHRGRISTIAFNRDGSRVVTASADGSARIWNAQTGESSRVLASGRTPVHSAAFNPSGNRVVTAHGDGSAAIWDVLTGRLDSRLQHSRSDVLRGDFSADGGFVLTSSDSGTAIVWDAASGRERARLNMRDEGVHAVFNPEGTLVVSASEAFDLLPTVWSSRDGAVRSHLSRTGGGIVSSFAFSPNGACVASGGQSGKLTVSQPVTGRAFAESHRFAGGISSLAFASDGRSLAVGTRVGTVNVVSTAICGDLDGLLQLARSKVVRSLTDEERRAYLQ